MLRPAVLILALAAGPALADNEHAFAPNPDGTVSFTMPSGNVGCTYIPASGTPVYQTVTGMAELHCTLVEPVYTSVVLDAHLGGSQPITGGEAPGLPIAGTLPYGAFWQAGPFTCLASRNGLTCTNGSGAGLRMARAGVVTW